MLICICAETDENPTKHIPPHTPEHIHIIKCRVDAPRNMYTKLKTSPTTPLFLHLPPKTDYHKERSKLKCYIILAPRVFTHSLPTNINTTTHTQITRVSPIWKTWRKGDVAANGSCARCFQCVRWSARPSIPKHTDTTYPNTQEQFKFNRDCVLFCYFCLVLFANEGLLR